MAKKKLLLELSDVKEPKFVDQFKRIFLLTSDEILEEIAVCMYDAYHTEGSDLTLYDYKHEIKLLLKGEYGEWSENASLYYEENGIVAGAIFISIYEGKPLLTYLFTRKLYLGEAVATRLIQLSAYILKLLKYTELAIYIDDRESETYNLYRVVGFKPVGGKEKK